MKGIIGLLIVFSMLVSPVYAGWELGFENPDGSQNTYDLDTGSWELGFGNSDGTQNTYDTKDGTWEVEFLNPDGSVNTYDFDDGEDNPREIKEHY